MPNSKMVTVGSLALALLLGAGAMVVHARENDDPKNAAIGMVDMERVFNASDAPVQLGQQAALIEAEAQKRMDAIVAAPQLTAKELEEYSDLVARAKPTMEQQNRINALKGLSDKRVMDYQALQMKANLTPEEGTRLKALQQQSRFFQQELPNIDAQLRAQAAQREETVRRGLMVQLRGEVAKVASEKKLANVFDTTAMVFSTNDITPAVIQRVSKRK